MTFDLRIAKELHDWVGGRCSSPTCQNMLLRPSSPGGFGEAAHIMGENIDSARYEPIQTENERYSAGNGLWLCRNCHRLIDRCQSAFPRDLLYQWKEDARARAVEDTTRRTASSTQDTVDLPQDRDRAMLFYRRHAPLAEATNRVITQRAYINLPEELRQAAHSVEPLIEPFASGRSDVCHEPLTLAYQLEMVRLVNRIRFDPGSPFLSSMSGATLDARTLGVDEDGQHIFASSSMQILAAHAQLHSGFMTFVDALRPSFGFGGVVS